MSSAKPWLQQSKKSCLTKQLAAAIKRKLFNKAACCSITVTYWIQKEMIANVSFYKSVRSQQINLSMLIQLYNLIKSSSIETNLFQSKKIKIIWMKAITTINQKILSNKALIRLYEIKRTMMLIFRNLANLS